MLMDIKLQEKKNSSKLYEEDFYNSVFFSLDSRVSNITNNNILE